MTISKQKNLRHKWGQMIRHSDPKDGNYSEHKVQGARPMSVITKDEIEVSAITLRRIFNGGSGVVDIRAMKDAAEEIERVAALVEQRLMERVCRNCGLPKEHSSYGDAVCGRCGRVCVEVIRAQFEAEREGR